MWSVDDLHLAVAEIVALRRRSLTTLSFFSQVGLTQLRSAAHAFSTYALDLHTVNRTSVHGSSGANCVL